MTQSKLTVIEGGTDCTRLLYYNCPVRHPSLKVEIVTDERHQLLCEMIWASGLFDVEALVGLKIMPGPFEPSVSNGTRSPWKVVSHLKSDIVWGPTGNPAAAVGERQNYDGRAGLTYSAELAAQPVVVALEGQETGYACINVLANEKYVGRLVYSWDNLADPPVSFGLKALKTGLQEYNDNALKQRQAFLLENP